MIPRLYKLAAINKVAAPMKQLGSDLLTYVLKASKIGNKDQRAVASQLLKGLRKTDQIKQMVHLGRQADNTIDLFGPLNAFYKNRQYYTNKPDKFKKLLQDIIIRRSGLTPLRSKNRLIGGIYGNKDNNHIILPFDITQSKPKVEFKDQDLFDLFSGMLSAKFGKVKVLPRATTDNKRVPSIYFGLLGDTEFNKSIYDLIQNNPNALPITQLNEKIGRIFSVRSHTYDGKEISPFTNWLEQKSKRYSPNHHVIALPQGYSVGLQTIGKDLSKYTKFLNKGQYIIPQALHWRPDYDSMHWSPVQFLHKYDIK